LEVATLSRYIGLDVGGTNIVGGLLNERCEPIRTTRCATEADRGPAHVLNRIETVINEMRAAAGSHRVEAVGIGIPGFVDPEAGLSVFAGNLGWHNVPLGAEMARRTGLPVFIDNDVRMYIYGEAMRGAGEGFGHVLGVTVGTGLAAAVVNEGRLYYGGAQMAGELGHIPLPGIDYTCPCGLTGCAERIVSATGIARQAADALQAGESSILSERFSPENGAKPTAADVAAAYDAGDALAIRIFERTGDYLGLALAYAVTLFSPDIVIVGGGVAQAGERLLAPARRRLQQSVYRGYWERLTIRTASLGEHAGLIGSALMASKQLMKSQQSGGM
jgi:glucokinase